MLLLPLRFKNLTERCLDCGAVQVWNRLVPCLTDKLGTSCLARWGEVKSCIVIRTSIQKCFDRVGVSL